MMTLDEAIRQAEARAKAPGYTEEFRQLVEWLKELKEYRAFFKELKMEYMLYGNAAFKFNADRCRIESLRDCRVAITACKKPL